MWRRMRATLVILIASEALALLGAGVVMARNPAPKNCGLTPSKTYLIHVDRGSPCGFGVATWHALFHTPNIQPDPFAAGEEVNFTLTVAYRREKTIVDCRALYRAHGEHDYYCNNLNRRGTRVVRLDNQTLP